MMLASIIMGILLALQAAQASENHVTEHHEKLAHQQISLEPSSEHVLHNKLKEIFDTAELLPQSVVEIITGYVFVSGWFVPYTSDFDTPYQQDSGFSAYPRIIIVSIENSLPTACSYLLTTRKRINDTGSPTTWDKEQVTRELSQKLNLQGKRYLKHYQHKNDSLKKLSKKLFIKCSISVQDRDCQFVKKSQSWSTLYVTPGITPLMLMQAFMNYWIKQTTGDRSKTPTTNAKKKDFKRDFPHKTIQRLVKDFTKNEASIPVFHDIAFPEE